MSDLEVKLYAKRILRTAEYCVAEVARLRGYRGQPFQKLSVRSRADYVRLAHFILQNNLHPKLYLMVMKEFSVNFYPRTLYGPKAFEKYRDYITKLKRRYAGLKNFSANDSSMNILRNDLFMVAACDPNLTPEEFYSDGPKRFVGYGPLKTHIDSFAEVIDSKSYKILLNLLEKKKVADCNYANLIRTAIKC